MIESRQEKRAELSLRRADIFEKASLEQVGKESLGQFLGVILTVTDRQPFNGPTAVALEAGTRVVGRELAQLLWCREAVR